MAVTLSPVGGVAAQFFDNSGNLLTYGQIYTYAAGTSTPQATYTSVAGTIASANPIILDASGRVPGGEIWLSSGVQYKFVLQNSVGATIGTYDNITGINSNFVNYSGQEQIQTATAGQTVFTLTGGFSYTPGTNTLQVFVDGVNQYDGSSYSYTETNSTTVTFTQGLHVGALVKFTTAVTLSAGVTASNLVTYQPAGIGAVLTNVQAKLRQTVSVMDFGATGNGTTDDTAAIQSAINAAGQNSLIYYPAGTYLISSSVTLLPQQIHSGEGAIISVGSGVNAFVLTASDGYPGRIRFENLRFQGVSRTGIAVNIINNAPFITINNCFFTGFSTAVYLSGSYCSNIQNCVFQTNYQGIVLVAASHSTQVINCLFDNNTTGLGINGTQSLGNLSSTAIHNVTSLGCAYQGGSWGVWVENAYEFAAYNTYCERNTTQDFRLGVADGGVYARACYHATVDSFQTASPCGSGNNIGLEHCVNANLRGISFNSGCSTTATLLTTDGYSAQVWLDYNNYTTTTVTSTAPFNFSGNSASKVLVSHNGQFVVPYGMSAFQFGTLASVTGSLSAGTVPGGSGRPAILLTSTGSSSQDLVIQTQGIERHFDVSNNYRFGVDNINSVVSFGYNVQPITDNSYSLGDAGHRFTTVYATTGTINTSDETQKTIIGSLSTAEQAVAKSIKGLFKTFKWNSAVAKKGDTARIHIGVIAQEVQAAFAANGLDATHYGIFCSDTWYEVNGQKQDEAGIAYTSTSQNAVAVTQLGIRYDELLAFVLAAN